MAVVSVVVSIYNTMQWLADCVESIRRQTLQDIEIILVDDGSTDYSGVICDAYADMDSRIRVIHRENGGDSAAKNTGMDIASGKYIMFCDSDDYVEPDWCRCAVDLIKQYPNTMIALSFEQLFMGNETIQQVYSETENCSILKYGEYSQIFKKMILRPVWNKIFRKDLITQFTLRFEEDVSYGEDFLFVLSYLDVVDSILIKNNPSLYIYRCWSRDTLSARYLGSRYFQFYAREAEIVKRFITEEESTEYFKWFFWIRGIESLNRVLDLRSPDSFEKQKQDCQEIISSREFQEWCGAAIKANPENALLQLLQEGNFQKAYEPLIQYLRQSGRLL